jgi:hypothetical protein
LEKTTAKSLSKANEILDLPLDPERTHYPSELRARTAIINTTLTTQARVGEAELHRETIDRLPEIIRLIQAEERRRAAQSGQQCLEDQQQTQRKPGDG